MLYERLRGIRCEAVECDEIWTFISKKEGTLKAAERQTHSVFGDPYTFIALEPMSKLVPAFLVGKRDSINTER